MNTVILIAVVLVTVIVTMVVTYFFCKKRFEGTYKLQRNAENGFYTILLKMKFIFSSAVMVLAQRESGQVLFLLLDEKPPSDNIRLKDGEVYTIFLSWAVLMARKSPSDKEVCDFIKKDHPAIM